MADQFEIGDLFQCPKDSDESERRLSFGLIVDRSESDYGILWLSTYVGMRCKKEEFESVCLNITERDELDNSLAED
jgi:hypothetical protein